MRSISTAYLPCLHLLDSEKLRASRTGISDADVTSEYTLGVAGQPFAFSQCQNKVALAEASALTGEIAEVEEFIREVVRP